MGKRGPNTPEGKTRASLNSLRHGINCERYLPCKRSRCFYQPICNLFCDPNNEPPEEVVPYGSDCPIEVAISRNILDELGSDPDISPEVLQQIISLTLKKHRISGLGAIDPHLVREVPIKGTVYTRPAFALQVRYRLPVTRKLIDVYEGIVNQRGQGG